MIYYCIYRYIEQRKDYLPGGASHCGDHRFPPLLPSFLPSFLPSGGGRGLYSRRDISGGLGEGGEALARDTLPGNTPITKLGPDVYRMPGAI